MQEASISWNRGGEKECGGKCMVKNPLQQWRHQHWCLILGAETGSGKLTCKRGKIGGNSHCESELFLFKQSPVDSFSFYGEIDTKMMHASQFDGAAAFSGGGFMPTQATQTTDPAASTSTKNRETQTLVPLTVNQINKALLSNAEKVNFLIDGVDVNNVKLVGRILNKAERVTDVSFVLDDGTGRIDCNRWVSEAIDTKEMEALLEGTYVRVHGHLKSFQGKKQLVTYGIKPVTDFDEITHHFVECIYVHSYNTKSMKQQANGNNQSHMPSSAVNTQTYQTAPPANQFTGQYVADRVKGIEKMMEDYLMLPGILAREAGVHVEELAKQLCVPVDKIMVAVHGLEVEGLVYNSVDEFHYKSTANG